jgi:hypothetical protein
MFYNTQVLPQYNVSWKNSLAKRQFMTLLILLLMKRVLTILIPFQLSFSTASMHKVFPTFMLSIWEGV